VVQRYKALADIERGIRVLNLGIDIAPVYHGLPMRIKAHAMLCFMNSGGPDTKPLFNEILIDSYSR